MADLPGYAFDLDELVTCARCPQPVHYDEGGQLVNDDDSQPHRCPGQCEHCGLALTRVGAVPVDPVSGRLHLCDGRIDAVIREVLMRDAVRVAVRDVLEGGAAPRR